MKLNEALQAPSIDWNHYEEKAKNMSGAELHFACADALQAARANPNTEGLYMDEISVYRTEQRGRGQLHYVTRR